MAEWLEALVWRLSQLGFDPSHENILFSHTDEFWWNETDLSVDNYIYMCFCFYWDSSKIFQLFYNVKQNSVAQNPSDEIANFTYDMCDTELAWYSLVATRHIFPLWVGAQLLNSPQLMIKVLAIRVQFLKSSVLYALFFMQHFLSFLLRCSNS